MQFKAAQTHLNVPCISGSYTSGPFLPTVPSLQVFLGKESSEPVNWTMLSFHLSLRDLHLGHTQPVHPIWRVHNWSIPFDWGNIPAVLGSASWHCQVKAINDKDWALFCHNHLSWGFVNPQKSIPLPRLCDYNSCLQDFSKKLSGTKRVELLQVMLIYTCCISSHFVFLFELKEPQITADPSAYLALTHLIHGSMPTRCSQTEFSKAWVGLCHNPLPAAWPQAFLLAYIQGEGKKKHKVWTKGGEEKKNFKKEE